MMFEKTLKVALISRNVSNYIESLEERLKVARMQNVALMIRLKDSDK